MFYKDTIKSQSGKTQDSGIEFQLSRKSQRRKFKATCVAFYGAIKWRLCFSSSELRDISKQLVLYRLVKT